MCDSVCGQLSVYAYTHMRRYMCYKSVHFCASSSYEIFIQIVNWMAVATWTTMEILRWRAVTSDCDCNQVTSSSKVSAVRRNCNSKKYSLLERHAHQLQSESIKCESNGYILGCLDGADSPDSWYMASLY